MAEDERRKRIEDALGQVQMLASVATETQVRAVLRVVAECSLAVSEELGDAAKEIRGFNNSMTAFNKATEGLSARLVMLNWLLFAAAAASAIAAAVSAWSAAAG